MKYPWQFSNFTMLLVIQYYKLNVILISNSDSVQNTEKTGWINRFGSFFKTFNKDLKTVKVCWYYTLKYFYPLRRKKTISIV